MARELAEVVDFGRYEPLFRIGLGGMAEVYAARIRGEAGFQKLVAIKRMLPHLTGDPKFVDMFLDEARLAANISSPQVVQTLDLGRADDGSLYIVMDLILGVTLSQMLRHMAEKREYVDAAIAAEIIAQAAQGLDDAHEASAPSGEPLHLVHRDISPQNILVGTDGRARVTDFGIAHALHLRRTETQVGEMKGKFAYFSPEQAFGKKSIDRRSDVFALGVVAWELFTGRRLFKGSPTEQLDAVKRGSIDPVSTFRPDLPPELSAAIMLALAMDRDARHASGAAFASSLRRGAAKLGEAPSSRAIGLFVAEVGGERLRRMQDCIAGSESLPADLAKATAIIDGRAAGAGGGTEVLSDPANAEATRMLHDSQILMDDQTITDPSVAVGGVPVPSVEVDLALASTVRSPASGIHSAGVTATTPAGLRPPRGTATTPATPGAHAASIEREGSTLANSPTSPWIASQPTMVKRRFPTLLVAGALGGALLLGLGVGIAVAFGGGDGDAEVPAASSPASTLGGMAPASSGAPSVAAMGEDVADGVGDDPAESATEGGEDETAAPEAPAPGEEPGRHEPRTSGASMSSSRMTTMRSGQTHTASAMSSTTMDAVTESPAMQTAMEQGAGNPLPSWMF